MIHKMNGGDMDIQLHGNDSYWYHKGESFKSEPCWTQNNKICFKDKSQWTSINTFRTTNVHLKPTATVWNQSISNSPFGQGFEHGLKALGSIPFEGWVQLVALIGAHEVLVKPREGGKWKMAIEAIIYNYHLIIYITLWYDMITFFCVLDHVLLEVHLQLLFVTF